MGERNFSPCLADTLQEDDRPPTHFFVKKKIHPFVRRRKCPARRRELFSLRKKRPAGIRLSAWQTFRSLHRSHPTPFPPLKRRESKGSQLPLAEVWGQRPQGLALRGPSGSQRPVLPKPPVPRAVLSSSGTSRSSGVQTGASTSCAIRSPGWISKGVSLWLVRGTWSSPR